MRSFNGRGGRSLGLALCALWLAPAAVAEAGPAPLRTGFYDPAAYQYGTAADRASALHHTRQARGSIIRIASGWPSRVGGAPGPPPSRAEGRNPAWSGYRWHDVDAVVRDVAAAGLVPFLTLTGAPAWAEGPGRPRPSAAAPAGTWRPSPSAYRDFAEAIARRYSGSYPDPARPGAPLPRVRHWQAWNEPNLTSYLTPQWERRRGRLAPASPTSYRRLLNAFYAGVKAVHRSNLVVSAGLAAFGDHQRGGRRLQPAYFTREFLCVRGRGKPRGFRCPDSPARFDALAHHSYSVGPPSREALNPDDVSVPDLWKLKRPLSAAIRAGKVFPRRRKQLWITEISWDSRPPDPDGVPARLHAKYLAGAFYALWRQGVRTVTWLHLRDDPVGPGHSFTYQSGIFERGDTVARDLPKPAFEAFRFPFTAYRERGRVRLWGMAPDPGRVTIERLRNGKWRAVRRLRAGRNRVFVARYGARRGELLRARRGSEASLSWRVR